MALQTFGRTEGGNRTNSIFTEGGMVASLFPSTGSGKLLKLTAQLTAVNSDLPPRVKALVYADNSGSPGSLLAVGEETIITNTVATNEVDLPFATGNQISITSATNYWLGFIARIAEPGVQLNYRRNTALTPPIPRYQGSDDYNSLSSTAPSGTIDNLTVVVYGTYDDAPGGGGGATNGFKVYNGSSWEVKPVKVYNGSSWEEKPLKRWDGSAWVPVEHEQ